MTKQYNDELKRAPAGKKYIYVITETETGKMYIGQTRNFHKRMCSHRNCGYSQHSAIDRVIQEKGVDAFEYEVLELCTEDEADERERYWIEKTDSCNEQKGFNIFKGGQKSFSDESYAMLVEMLQQGMTLKNACDAMNTSSTSARREIKRRGTNLSEIRSLAAKHKHLRRKSAHRKEINITDVLKMYQDGMTSKEIASHYDMNPSAFYRRLKENGLSARAIVQPNYGTASTLFDKDKAISMRKDGYTAREIGATMDYSTFHNWIYSALSKALEEDKKQNNKLDVLLEEYASVRMSITENQEAINDFIDNVCQIADLVNSDDWNGEDVMAIFFNEFNRYRGKAQAGQVFTPDHIASFMYRLIDVNMNDRVLDATCGSGTFLVKSMCNMIREAGGSNTSKAKQIKSEQLFGIEMYRKVYALACANMMIHKDGKTNLVQMDATSAETTEWIRKQKITKVLMNPPYERRYGCATIVGNVLDSVPAGTKCAFILPDKKMEKESKLKALLERHTLATIIKLPENVFFGLGVTTSIFIFETGKPQNGRNIKGYYVADDGLETVKNKGRQDIHDKWPALEDYWVKAIQDDNDNRYNTRQLINPAEHLSYQMPEKPFELYEEDFIKTVMDYEMYKRGINAKEFGDKLLQKVLYGSTVTGTEEGTNILVEKGENNNGED